MPKKIDLCNEDLTNFLDERGMKVVEKFKEAATQGVTNSELLSILADVKDYWKDTFRPALSSIACEAVGGQPKMVEGISLMITLTAAGIGIHDDIIDQSLNKHFRMTILGLHNRDHALLAGDLLIVKGLTIVQEALNKNHRLDKLKDVIKTYQQFLIEVCEAEFNEISCRRNLDTELKDYLDILWKSTSDTEACTRLGAMLGDGSQSEIQALSEIGRRLGFMCRLADDLKDSLNIEGTLAHRLGNESVPLPILYAAKSSKKRFTEIQLILEKSSINSSDVKKLLECCFDSDAFSYVHSIARDNAIEAKKQLRSLKRCSARTVLRLMIQRSLAEVMSLPR